MKYVAWSKKTWRSDIATIAKACADAARAEGLPVPDVFRRRGFCAARAMIDALRWHPRRDVFGDASRELHRIVFCARMLGESRTR